MSVRAPVQSRRLTLPQRVILYMLVLVSLGRIHDLTPVTQALPVGKVLIPLAWLVFLFQPDARQRLRALAGTQTKMFWVLVFGMFVSIPFSLYRGGSVFEMQSFLQGTFTLVLVVAVLCAREDMLMEAGRAIVLTGLVLGLAIGAGLGETRSGRTSVGATYDANDIALVGVIVFPLAVWVMRGQSKLWKLIGIGGALGALSIVMTAASRGGMLGLASVLILIGIRYRKRIPAVWKLAAVAMVGVALYFAPPTFWERFQTLKDPTADYNTFSELGRSAIWKRGVGYFASRPLTGVGLGQFSAAEGAWVIASKGTSAGFKWSGAHSIWIQVIAEVGLFGLIGFLGLYLPTLRDVKRARRTLANTELQAFGEALGIMIIGFFITGSFLAMAYSPPAMLIAALGMGYAFCYRQRLRTLAQPVPAATPARGRAVSGRAAAIARTARRR